MTNSSPRSYNTGIIAAMLTALAIGVITGIALMPVYKPDAHSAYSSVLALTQTGFLGFVRGMHHWSSAVLIILGGAYIIAGLFTGAYQKPGQGLWIGTIVMFLIGVAMQITGHLLPFDVQAVRTAVVETGIASNAPVVGEAQGNLMRGGASVGENTLHLWYVAHVGLFMALSLVLLFVIPMLAKKVGETVKNFTWIFGAFIAVLVMAIILRAPLGHPAGLADYTDSGARPEWYILPLHSLLVLAQNLNPKMAFVGTMLIPGLAVLLLFALPWIHRRESEGISRTLGVVSILALGGLCFYSYKDVAPPIGDQMAGAVASNGSAKPIKLDPKLVTKGRDLFEPQGCADCHAIKGKGGKIGPDLSNEASKARSLDWQVKHLQDPKSTTPGSTMPAFNKLPKDQLDALAQYVSALKG
jgi:quinol-cytochrome oxidoreductase complex cytochrome b subunit/cytochrome c551/c552